jgi:hypothetical protein
MDHARYLRASLACVAAMLANASASAATQGTLGTTSTGAVTINASVANHVQLTGLTDVSFLNQDPAVAASNAQNVCVWSNTSTKGYFITATGSGTASAFTLANGALTVPYSVEWAGSSAQASGSPLTTATALHGLTSSATNPTCSAGPSSTASLIVKISTANLASMQAATTYTGTLTLVVAPE